jgi:hypothetical protein
VENYVRECDDCHRIKQGREYTAPLGDVRQLTYLKVFHWIFVDHIPSLRGKTSTSGPSLIILQSMRKQFAEKYVRRIMYEVC